MKNSIVYRNLASAIKEAGYKHYQIAMMLKINGVQLSQALRDIYPMKGYWDKLLSDHYKKMLATVLNKPIGWLFKRSQSHIK